MKYLPAALLPIICASANAAQFDLTVTKGQVCSEHFVDGKRPPVSKTNEYCNKYMFNDICLIHKLNRRHPII
jgi:hypothetical protein